MRWAKSYGIIDHELLHGRYLHRLSHVGLSLYLFLAVVADSNGKSFYGTTTILDILKLRPEQFDQALRELILLKLVDYRRPHFFLLNLESSYEQRTNQSHSVSQRRSEAILQTDRRRTQHLPTQSVVPLLRQLCAKVTKNFPP